MCTRLFLLSAAAALAASSAFAQYKMEPVAGAAPDLPAAYASAIQPQGYRITGPSGPWCEIWFRASLPAGPKSDATAVSFPTIAQGALLGVIRFPANGADRRGQTVKPGLYTLRYSINPVDGDHQGVAPQRDFVLLAPVALDPDPASMPAFDPLVAMSRKASGTPHPAVLSLETPAGDAVPAFAQEGEKDWALSVKVGDVKLSIILVGKAEA